MVVLRELEYLGGHPAAPSPLDRIDMYFDDAGVRFERKADHLGSIPWDRVRDLTAEAEVVTSRVTGPRVWLFGIFAMLVPRRERRVLLRLADDRGGWLFHVDGIGLDEIRAGLDRIRRRHLG